MKFLVKVTQAGVNSISWGLFSTSDYCTFTAPVSTVFLAHLSILNCFWTTMKLFGTADLKYVWL